MMPLDIARASSAQAPAGSLGVLGAPVLFDLAPGVYLMQTDGDCRMALNGRVSNGSMRLADRTPMTIVLRQRTALHVASYGGTDAWVWVVPVAPDGAHE